MDNKGNMNNVISIIMAGGMGKRMGSTLPKVLHHIGGIPMINRIILNIKQLSTLVNLKEIIVVVGKYKDQIKEAIEELTDLPNIVYVTQEVPQGTGHAIMCCKEELSKYPDYQVLILSGDVPMLSFTTMFYLISREHNNNNNNNNDNVKLITADISPPDGYGRVAMKDGKFDKIVEHKDCNEEELRITQINAGIYCIKSDLLCKYLPYIKNNNNQGEYYLTDIIEIIKREEQIDVGILEIEKDKTVEIVGINTLEQLCELEVAIQNKIDNNLKIYL